MSDVKKNPDREPQDPKFEPRFFDREDYPTTIGGPGGKATLTENNEKGILEGIVFDTMDPLKQATLGSSHDSHGVGIYAEGREKYSD